MHKNVLQSIAGIEIYPLISLAIFFLFFVGLLVYVAVASRQHLSAMSQLPLADEPNETPNYHSNRDALC